MNLQEPGAWVLMLLKCFCKDVSVSSVPFTGATEHPTEVGRKKLSIHPYIISCPYILFIKYNKHRKENEKY